MEMEDIPNTAETKQKWLKEMQFSLGCALTQLILDRHV